MCTVQIAHGVIRPSDGPVIEYPTCATFLGPPHQVSYSCHDSRRCPSCHTCYLHTTRQAIVILHMNQRIKVKLSKCPRFATATFGMLGMGTFRRFWCSSINTWTFIPLLLPLIPPAMSRRLRGRLLLAPWWDDPAVRAVLFLLLKVVIPMMMLRPHCLRLEVAVVQQQFHILRTSPLQVHSCRRLCASVRAQL
jgi:hypothetical protein